MAGNKKKMGEECFQNVRERQSGCFWDGAGSPLVLFPTQPKLLQIRIGQMFSGTELCSLHTHTPTFLQRCAGKECTYLQFVHVTVRSFLAYQFSTLLHPNATQSVCIKDARTISSGNIIEKENLTVCLVTDYCIDLLFKGVLIESVKVKLKCSAGENEKTSTQTSNPH